MLVQKAVYFQSDFFGIERIQPVKSVTARCILENLVLERLLGGFERLNEVFYLKNINIFIIGVGMNEKGGLPFHAGDRRRYSFTSS